MVRRCWDPRWAQTTDLPAWPWCRCLSKEASELWKDVRGWVGKAAPLQFLLHGSIPFLKTTTTGRSLLGQLSGDAECVFQA